MKKLTIVFLLVLGFFIMPVKAGAQTEATLITANPGEDSSSMMNISWNMDTSKTNGRVVYTKASDTNWENATTVYGDKNLVDVFHEREFYHYFVELTDLDSNTKYMYKVGQDSLSEQYYFKTGGSDSFNFLWISDWHGYAPLPGRTDKNEAMIRTSLLIEPDIDFIFSTGDDLAYGSDYEAQEYLYNKPQYKSHMFATTVGNHDVMNVVNGEYRTNTDAFFKNTHYHPQNGYEGQVGASYYFKYGTALFIVLNNEDINYGHSSKSVGLAKAKAWTQEVIDNNPAQYIIVAMHYQWFDGRHGRTSAQYTDWRNFFDENNVDLAMAGNNHVYLRSKGRIYNDNPTGTNKGTVYMQAPSSDGERGVQHGDIVNNEHIIEEVWSQGAYTIGSIIVNVTPDGISHRLIDNVGRVRASGEFDSRYKDYNFNKEDFLNSIEVFTNENEKIITANEEGIKFVDRIEYYDDETLLGVNYFYQVKDTTYKLQQNEFNNLKARVLFSDGTISRVDLFNESYYHLKDVSLAVKEENLELRWNYDKEEDFNLYIYENDIFIKEVSVLSNSTLLQGVNLESTIKIKPKINSLNTYYTVKYNNIGDANLDKEIDLKDAQLILDYLSGKTILSETEKLLLDIDGDEEITIIDLTYLHLYINGNSSIKSKESYNISFYNYEGLLIETVKAYRGSDITPPSLELKEDLIFIGWDKSLNNISSDLEVRPIVVWR